MGDNLDEPVEDPRILRTRSRSRSGSISKTVNNTSSVNSLVSAPLTQLMHRGGSTDKENDDQLQEEEDLLDLDDCCSSSSSKLIIDEDFIEDEGATEIELKDYDHDEGKISNNFDKSINMEKEIRAEATESPEKSLLDNMENSMGTSLSSLNNIGNVTPQSTDLLKIEAVDQNDLKDRVQDGSYCVICKQYFRSKGCHYSAGTLSIGKMKRTFCDVFVILTKPEAVNYFVKNYKYPFCAECCVLMIDLCRREIQLRATLKNYMVAKSRIVCKMANVMKPASGLASETEVEVADSSLEATNRASETSVRQESVSPGKSLSEVLEFNCGDNEFISIGMEIRSDNHLVNLHREAAEEANIAKDKLKDLLISEKNNLIANLTSIDEIQEISDGITDSEFEFENNLTHSTAPIQKLLSDTNNKSQISNSLENLHMDDNIDANDADNLSSHLNTVQNNITPDFEVNSTTKQLELPSKQSSNSRLVSKSNNHVPTDPESTDSEFIPVPKGKFKKQPRMEDAILKSTFSSDNEIGKSLTPIVSGSELENAPIDKSSLIPTPLNDTEGEEVPVIRKKLNKKTSKPREIYYPDDEISRNKKPSDIILKQSKKVIDSGSDSDNPPIAITKIGKISSSLITTRLNEKEDEKLSLKPKKITKKTSKAQEIYYSDDEMSRRKKTSGVTQKKSKKAFDSGSDSDNSSTVAVSKVGMNKSSLIATYINDIEGKEFSSKKKKRKKRSSNPDQHYPEEEMSLKKSSDISSEKANEEFSSKLDSDNPPTVAIPRVSRIKTNFTKTPINETIGEELSLKRDEPKKKPNASEIHYSDEEISRGKKTSGITVKKSKKKLESDRNSDCPPVVISKIGIDKSSSVTTAINNAEGEELSSKQNKAKKRTLNLPEIYPNEQISREKKSSDIILKKSKSEFDSDSDSDNPPAVSISNVDRITSSFSTTHKNITEGEELSFKRKKPKKRISNPPEIYYPNEQISREKKSSDIILKKSKSEFDSGSDSDNPPAVAILKVDRITSSFSTTPKNITEDEELSNKRKKPKKRISNPPEIYEPNELISRKKKHSSSLGIMLKKYKAESKKVEEFDSGSDSDNPPAVAKSNVDRITSKFNTTPENIIEGQELSFKGKKPKKRISNPPEIYEPNELISRQKKQSSSSGIILKKHKEVEEFDSGSDSDNPPAIAISKFDRITSTFSTTPENITEGQELPFKEKKSKKRILNPPEIYEPNELISRKKKPSAILLKKSRKEFDSGSDSDNPPTVGIPKVHRITSGFLTSPINNTEGKGLSLKKKRNSNPDKQFAVSPEKNEKMFYEQKTELLLNKSKKEFDAGSDSDSPPIVRVSKVGIVKSRFTTTPKNITEGGELRKKHKKNILNPPEIYQPNELFSRKKKSKTEFDDSGSDSDIPPASAISKVGRITSNFMATPINNTVGEQLSLKRKKPKKRTSNLDIHYPGGEMPRKKKTSDIILKESKKIFDSGSDSDNPPTYKRVTTN